MGSGYLVPLSFVESEGLWLIFESRRGLILIEKSLKRELEKAKTFYLYLYIGCVCKSEKNAIGKNLKVQSKS